MASFLGILGGAMKGAGEAGADIAQGWIRNEQALDLERERDSIMMQREQRVAELRERMRREGDAYDWQQKQDRAPTQNKMDAERTGIIGKAQTEVELDRVQKVEPARQEIQRKGKNAEREDALDFETTNIDAIASNARKKARATDLDGEGRRLRNEIAQLTLDEAKLTADDRKDLREADKALVDAKTPEEFNAAKKRVDALIYRMRSLKERADPLSSRVSAAKAILADMDASEEERAAARQFLAGSIGGQGSTPSAKPAADRPPLSTWDGKAAPRATDKASDYRPAEPRSMSEDDKRVSAGYGKVYGGK